MNILKEKCQVVMLATEKASVGVIMKYIKLALLHDDSLDLKLNQILLNKNVNVKSSNEYWEAQHLYILSNDEIEKGDWLIFENTVVQHKGFDSEGFLHLDYLEPNGGILVHKDNLEDCKKIVAATDNSLDITPFGGQGILILPQPSQEFIEKYVKKYNEGNPITEILVEYWLDDVDVNETNWKLIPKINPKDNTINISKIL